MMRAAGITLVIIATVAYFFPWNTVPPGYYTDAASNVLNALCIRHTGADEYGRFLPTTIRAFDDYRPPLLIYLFSLSSFFHQLTTESARFMGMSLGWGALLLFFAVLRKRLPLPPIRWEIFYPLLFALTLCSPWVLVPHRMPVEFVSTLPVTLFLLLTSWRWIQQPDSHRAAVTAALATGLMLYAYYGTKPISFSQVALLFAVHLLHHGRLPRSSFSYLIVWSLLAMPTLLDLFGEQRGLTRFQAVGNASFADSVNVFFQHLGPDFLFLTGDHNPRHHTGYGGMLNAALLPFGIVGGLALGREVLVRRNTFWIFVSLFLVSALLPVSLTHEGLPHALRTLPVLLPLVMVFILGFACVEGFLRDWRRVRWAVFTGFLLFGGWSAYKNLDYYHREAVFQEFPVWTYYPGDYTLPPSPVLPDDHAAASINERYERVALGGDLVYCCGDDVVLTLVRAIDTAPPQDLNTQGTRAFNHQKFLAIALAHRGRSADALAVIRDVYVDKTIRVPDLNDVTVHRYWSEITLASADDAAARGDSVDISRLYRESLVAATRVAYWSPTPEHLRIQSMVLQRLGTQGMIDLGDLYIEEGNVTLGVYAYQNAMNVFPIVTADEYAAIGARLSRADRRQEATEAYRKAIDLDPLLTEVHVSLGRNLLLDGVDSEAIRHFQAARTLQPSPAVLFNLGFAYLRTGQVDSARSAYREGVELFGVNGGTDMKAPDNLRRLIREGIHPEAAREILSQYWEQER